MEYRVLGPLEVQGGNGLLPLGGEKQRALLALLLLNANHVVSRDRLIDELWGDEPPQTAVQTVHVYVSRIRKLLPAETLQTRASGYVLRVGDGELDLHRFRELRAAGRPREALALWRGPPEFEQGRLEELRLAAVEERIDADLASGGHADMIGELETLIAEHPHREPFRAQLMRALYRSGRQAESLAAFRDARTALDELGLEPSAELRELERAILTHDGSLELPQPLVKTIELPGPLRVKSPFPFVGRERELDQLRELLALARQGEGQIALIAGDAGSGKTRLIREFAQTAIRDGVLVIHGTTNAVVNVPYGPVVEWLRFLLRSAAPDALTSYLGPTGGELSRLVPELSRLASDLPGPVQADPETERARLRAAVREFLVRTAASVPIVLIADDVHWIDAASLQVIREVIQGAPEARVLMLLAYRPRTEDARPELTHALSDLYRSDAVVRLTLAPLDPGDIAEFASRAIPVEGVQASSALTAAVGELTDGNPFLLCELWRALAEQNAVEVTDGTLELVQPLVELRSPEGVREVVHFRVSRLSDAAAALVEAASVIGDEFELRLLDERAELRRAIDAAAAAGMVESDPGPPPVYRFAHELFRRAVYDRIEPMRRAELHLQVATAYEERYRVEDVLPALAHQFTLALPVGPQDKAIEYNVRAARAAIATLAYEDAVARVLTAVELGVTREVAEVASDLALLLMDSSRLAEAERLLAEAATAAARTDDPEIVSHLDAVSAYAGIWEASATDDELQEIAKQAIEALSQTRNELGLAHAWRLLSYAHVLRCEWCEAETAIRRGLEHAQRAHDPREESTAVSWLLAAISHGPTEVRAALAECDVLRSAYRGDALLQARTGSHMAVLTAMDGRFDEARTAAASALESLAELGMTKVAAVARAAVSEIEMLAGDPAAAAAGLALAQAALEEAGERSMSSAAAAELARALCAGERFDAAAESLGQHPELVGHSDLMVRSTALDVEARLALHAARRDDALTHARAAVQVLERSDAINLRARALETLADVHAAAGDEPGAVAARKDALTLYRRKGNVAAAAQAEARSRRPTSPSSPRTTAGGT